MSSAITLTRITLSIPLAIWHLVLILRMIYKLKFSKSPPRVNKTILGCVLSYWAFGCISWSINSIGLPIYTDYDYLSSNVHAVTTIFIMLQWITLIFSCTSAYLFVIANLYYSFIGSAFETKKWIFYMQGVIIFIVAVLSIFAMISFYLWGNISLGLFLFAIAMILFLCGGAHLVYKFSHNLFLLTIMQSENATEMNHIINNEPELQKQQTLNEKQLQIVYLITKISVLSHVNGFFGLLVALLIVFKAIYKNIIVLSIIFWIVFAAYCILITGSFYMMLAMNEKAYAFCCAICDDHFIQICQKLAKSNAQKKSIHTTINSVSTI